MISIPLPGLREMTVQRYRRTDEEVHPETVRPWGSIGPIVYGEGRIIGLAMTGPRHGLAVYVSPVEWRRP